jgi:hypothetical protein
LTKRRKRYTREFKESLVKMTQLGATQKRSERCLTWILTISYELRKRICGKEELSYLFTIRNTRNGNLLYPIGSSCIRKFERDDLDEDASIKEQLFKLLHAIEKNEFITLSSDLFSRKLLFCFYDEDVFKPNSYNRYNPEVDYEFMLQMFNKRNKDSISTLQQRKISAIIRDSIRPYLRAALKDKIKRRREGF